LSHRFLEQALELRESVPLAWVQPGLVPLVLELLVLELQELEPLAWVLQELVLAYPAQVYPVQVLELVDLSLERA
jgi:hypothetical protein